MRLLFPAGPAWAGALMLLYMSMCILSMLGSLAHVDARAVYDVQPAGHNAVGHQTNLPRAAADFAPEPLESDTLDMTNPAAAYTHRENTRATAHAVHTRNDVGGDLQSPSSDSGVGMLPRPDDFESVQDDDVRLWPGALANLKEDAVDTAPVASADTVPGVGTLPRDDFDTSVQDHDVVRRWPAAKLATKPEDMVTGTVASAAHTAGVGTLPRDDFGSVQDDVRVWPGGIAAAKEDVVGAKVATADTAGNVGMLLRDGVFGTMDYEASDVNNFFPIRVGVGVGDGGDTTEDLVVPWNDKDTMAEPPLPAALPPTTDAAASAPAPAMSVRSTTSSRSSSSIRRDDDDIQRRLDVKLWPFRAGATDTEDVVVDAKIAPGASTENFSSASAPSVTSSVSSVTVPSLLGPASQQDPSFVAAAGSAAGVRTFRFFFFLLLLLI